MPACREMATLLEENKSSLEAVETVLPRALKGYLVYNRRPIQKVPEVTVPAVTSNEDAPPLSPTGTTANSAIPPPASTLSSADAGDGALKKPLSASPGKKAAVDAAAKKTKRTFFFLSNFHKEEESTHGGGLSTAERRSLFCQSTEEPNIGGENAQSGRFTIFITRGRCLSTTNDEQTARPSTGRQDGRW